MKRSNLILVGIVGLAAVVVGGWSAVWFAGKGEAQRQVETALAALSQAGATTSYEGVAISGFPFGYRAEVAQLVADSTTSKVTLPVVSAAVTVDAADTVTFELPAKFDVFDKTRGDVFSIASEALTADISPAAEGVYNLALQAKKLTVSSTTGGAPGPTTFTDFDTSGVFALSEDLGDARLSLSLTASDAVQKFRLEEGEGEALTGAAQAYALDMSIEGSLSALAGSFASERVSVEFDGGGVFEILKPSYTISAKPKERFDPTLLQEATGPRSALRAFGAMAMQGVAEGGAAETELKFASLRGSGEIEGRPNSADIEAFAFAAAFGAQKVALSADAKKSLVDFKLPDGTEYYFSAADQFSAITATPPDAFDFSILATTGANALGLQAVGAEIYTKLLQGGSAEFIGRGGPSVSRSSDPSAVTPFKTIETESEGGTSRIALNAKEAVIAIVGEAISYKVSDGLDGEAELDGIKIDFYSPLEAAPEPQKAQLRLSVEETTLSDQLWALLDPQSALKREIKGLGLNTEAELVIRRDLLAANADPFNLANPGVIPGKLTIADTFLELLGARADLSGAFSVAPLPSGSFDLRLAGWRQLFSGLQKTPMAEDPQFVSSLLMMNDLVVGYGAPLDPADPEADALKFDIRLGPTGVTINDKPFAG